MNHGEIVAGNIATAGDAPGLALRDACLGEIEAAEAELAAAGRRRPYRAVHHARKAVRRARTALALGALGDDETDAIDKALKRMAKTLSRVRDAAVAVETYGRLARHSALREIAPALHPLRVQLATRREDALSLLLHRDPAFARLRARLLAVCVRVRALRWRDIDARNVERALKKAARQAEKVGAAARHRSGENLRHRWRRRLRRLNDQHVLLDGLMSAGWPANPADGHKLAARLDRIAASDFSNWRRRAQNVHALGLEHDARLLRRIVRTSAEIDAAAREQLLAVLNRRLRKLAKRTAKG